MILFLICFSLPTLALLIIFNKINLFKIKQILILLSINLIICIITVLSFYLNQISDTEIWNGTVVSKSKELVSCEHSYSCNCRESCTGSGQNKSCTTICDTCYDHNYDYDYVVNTSNSEVILIDRVDRQGLITPDRFNLVEIGESTAIKHNFENYFLGSKDSLFKDTEGSVVYKKHLIDYPDKIYDYYKLNRVLFVNGNNKFVPQDLNKELNSLNQKFGKDKQSNIILVFVNDLDSKFFYSLRRHWVGGKKNDIIVVVGLQNEKIIWAQIMSLTEDDLFSIKLRDSILENEVIDNRILSSIEKSMVYFKRKPMKDFEYLKYDFTIPFWIPLLSWFLQVIVIFIGYKIEKSYYSYNNFYRLENKRRYLA